MTTTLKNMDSFAASVKLSGVDLNDITTPGAYHCESSSAASGLSHCPASSAFSMLVLHKSGGSYVTQLIFAGSNCWERTYSSSAFGHWYKFTMTDTGA